MELDAAMKQAMEITGAVGVCLVDYDSGMTLGALGGTDVGLDLEVAAAGNTEVVRAKQNTMKALGLTEKIEDILITLNSQYHLIRLVSSPSGQGLFFYLALDKSKSNLALARRALLNIEQSLDL